MNANWSTLKQKVDALQTRERIFVFVALLATIVMLIGTFVYEPLYDARQRLLADISQDRARITDTKAALDQRTVLLKMDPDAPDRERLRQIAQKMSAMQTTLSATQGKLVPADKMLPVLDELLKRNQGLTLLALKTLPVERLTTESVATQNISSGSIPVASADASAIPIYRHGVEVVVQGRYANMLDYLTQLESLPWQLRWSGVNVTVNDYPVSTMTLTVHTLSLDQRWLHL